MAQKNIRDYSKLAKDIINSIGEENIVNATHCATRLRLTLKKSPSAEITKQISAMPAVIQVVEKGGQYQIVIGTHAKDVYAEMMKIGSFDSEGGEAPKQGLVNQVIAMMSGCITPFVYVLAAAGLLQGILIIIRLFADIGNTGAAQIYDMISWTPFTFLPVMITVAGSKHFKCNTYIALWCGLALTNPTWANIAASISEGTPLNFLFVPLTSVTYTSTVIPAIALVGVLSLLEHWIEPKIPEFLRPIGTPLICAAIMVPLTIIVIGPISTIIANALANAYNMLYAVVPWLASGLLGAVWQVLVIFGVHWSFTPISVANFANLGYDLLQPCQGIAVCAQTAACFGVFFKAKSMQNKNVAASAAATGLFGITEPAIYGVTLRLKKPFICGCIGAAAGSIVASFFGARYFIFAGLSGFLSIPNSIYDAAAQANCEALGGAGNYSSSIYGVLIGTIVACAVAFILVQIIGFDEQTEEAAPAEGPALAAASQAAISEVKIPTGGTTTLYTPMNGEVKALKEVNDPTFAEGILGQGVAIIPREGKLYAPCDGTVSSVFDTKHAIGITTNDGVEMLIHIGLDTVTLGGKYFEAKVKDNDVIKKGDLLIEFDIKAIQSAGFDIITPVLVVNVDDFAGVNPVTESGTAKVGAELLKVKR
ncbi:MAG: glucose PTS transporter subunit IIA [Clostridia bacterium]|nr:glucose PTS transporter subunit IIA [Clostridia bacterium]